MARGDTLERIGDEVARAALRLALRLLVQLAHAPGEIVPDELLRLGEQSRLRFGDGHATDPLELCELALLRFLQVFLELLDVRLAVGNALVAPLELPLPALDLVLAGQEALLDLRHARALLADLPLDLRPEPHGLLARLDFRLAANGLGLHTGIGHARASEEAQRDEDDGAGDQGADQNCRNDE